MHGLPYRRLAGFYFFYFAYLGAFAPFFGLYLDHAGLSAVEIGSLMSLPQVTRIIAPHLWGWLADHTSSRLRVVRLTGFAGTLCYLGVFLGREFGLLFAVLFAMTFFWSAALPLVEATTLAHLGDETARYGRIRVWGSIGFIVLVVGGGHALDRLGVSTVPSMVLLMMLGMLSFAWSLPEVRGAHATTEDTTIWQVMRRPETLALITASGFMAAAHGPYYTFYSIHVVSYGYSKAVTGWLWALGVICEIGIFWWMPHLYRAFSLRTLLVVSCGLAVVRFLAIGWAAESFAVLLFAQTLHAATFGSFHAASIGVIHRLFRGRHQARGQAIYGSLAFGIGGALGGFASGYAWENLGPAVTFSAGAGCAAVAMTVLWAKLHLPRD